jgi:hypothetical protein
MPRIRQRPVPLRENFLVQVRAGADLIVNERKNRHRQLRARARADAIDNRYGLLTRAMQSISTLILGNCAPTVVRAG